MSSAKLIGERVCILDGRVRGDKVYGTIEREYKHYYLVLTDGGYRTTVLKTDVNSVLLREVVKNV